MFLLLLIINVLEKNADNIHFSTPHADYCFNNRFNHVENITSWLC